MTWWYVDPTDGLADGTGTEADPVRHLDDLTGAEAYAAGDKLLLKKGTVHRASHDMTASGSELYPITIGSYGTGAKPKIDAGEVVKGFSLYGSDEITDGGFENWSTSATPDDWTEDADSTNDVLQETSGVYVGSSCAKFVLAGAWDCHVKQTITAGNIVSSRGYRFAYAAKSSIASGEMQYKIVRDPGGTPYYWEASTDSWTTADTWNTNTASTTIEWQKFAIDFETESGDASFDFDIYIGPVESAGNVGSFWLDAVQCGKIPLDSTNYLGNWKFDTWAGPTLPGTWRKTVGEDCVMKQSDNERFGTYGVEFQTNADADLVCLRQKFDAGDIPAGTYRIGMHHHIFRQTDDCNGKMAFRVERTEVGQTTYTQVHDGSIWASDLGVPPLDVTASSLDYEYAFLNERVNIVVDRDHAVRILPLSGDYGLAAERPPQYQRCFADAVSLILDDIEVDCAWTYFDQTPSSVFVSGTVDGTTYDHLQLFEDDSIDDKPTGGTNDPYPHIFGYYYDSTNKKLYVNLGQDTSECTIDVSVRDTTLNLNGKSHIVVQDVDFYHSTENGLDLGYADAAVDRPENIKIDNCAVYYAGWVGILAGQRPDDPDTTEEFPDGVGYTPKDITIQDCYVGYFNRSRLQNLICEKGGVTQEWYEGYSTPNSGILVASGIQDTTEDGDDCGDISIRRCEVESDLPLINYSSERNGIWVATGENVYIIENKVTGVDHGIYVCGGWSLLDPYTHYGDVYNYEVKGNLVYDVGDDCCWIRGCYLPSSKVCYNIFGRTGDNCLDINKSSLVEVYNNTFYGDECENECIIIWINYYNPSAVGAYIYNNVFDRWGDVWSEAALGVSRAVAIGIGPGADTGDSIHDSGTVKIDHNTYYQPSTVTATYQYPFHIAVNDGAGSGTVTRYTFAEWQAFGYDLNSKVEDPKTNDPDSGDFTYKASSPVFHDGIKMTDLVESIYFSATALQVTRWFDRENATTQVLAQTSSWPGAVVWEDQPRTWHKGAWGKPTATITKGTTEENFPTTGILEGAPVYAVDETSQAQKIWKGVVTGTTAPAITLDGWEPLFNAEAGTGPTGSVTYYIGYVFLYDKTPQLAFMNTWRNKTLREVEIHGKRITGAVPVYAKIDVNDGGAEHVDTRTMTGDHRVRFEWTGGAHNIFHFEHALLVNQEFDVKSQIYHGSWRHGALEQ